MGKFFEIGATDDGINKYVFVDTAYGQNLLRATRDYSSQASSFRFIADNDECDTYRLVWTSNNHYVGFEHCGSNHIAVGYSYNDAIPVKMVKCDSCAHNVWTMQNRWPGHQNWLCSQDGHTYEWGCMTD